MQVLGTFVIALVLCSFERDLRYSTVSCCFGRSDLAGLPEGSVGGIAFLLALVFCKARWSYVLGTSFGISLGQDRSNNQRARQIRARPAGSGRS